MVKEKIPSNPVFLTNGFMKSVKPKIYESNFVSAVARLDSLDVISYRIKIEISRHIRLV